MIANLRHAARNRETVTIGGGMMQGPELLEAAHMLACHAPLLDALQGLADAVERFTNATPQDWPELAAARAAIANAKGGQP